VLSVNTGGRIDNDTKQVMIQALDQVSFHFAAGNRAALIGHNGAAVWALIVSCGFGRFGGKKAWPGSGAGGSAGDCSYPVNFFQKIGLESYARSDNVSELMARSDAS